MSAAGPPVGPTACARARCATLRHDATPGEVHRDGRVVL